MQIEVSANEPVDLFAVMVTRSNNRVESVVCVPKSRGRSFFRNDDKEGERPDPERFKSPIKDGRRSALDGRQRKVHVETTTTTENGNIMSSVSPRNCSGVRFIPDYYDEMLARNSNLTRGSKQQHPPVVGQKYHLRIACPNGLPSKRGVTFNGACSKNSMANLKKH